MAGSEDLATFDFYLWALGTCGERLVTRVMTLLIPRRMC